MDADAATEVEVAIGSAATVHLRLEKYRRGRADDVMQDRRLLAALGSRARQASRAGDEPALLQIRADIAALAARAVGVVKSIIGSPSYRDAVAAHRDECDADLEPLLLDIFAGLVRGPASGEAYVALDWSSRRGPKATEDVILLLEDARDTGFRGDGDPLDPGVDPELPAVRLRRDWPDGAPIAAACRLDALPGPTLQGETNELLLYRRLARVPFTVVFQSERDMVDEWVSDLDAYHADFVPVLTERGFATRSVPVPAAP